MQTYNHETKNEALNNLLINFGKALAIESSPESLLYVLHDSVLKPYKKKDEHTNQWLLTRPSTEQIIAFLMVANQYKLNPFLKEIHAFVSKGGGIVPMVGYDGWVRMMNTNSKFSGIETRETFSEQGILISVTCSIWRKDRNNPITLTEYLSECYQDNDVWRKYPVRMLRNKAIIQCIRLAFGYGGIYDEDEAQRILESSQYEEIKNSPSYLPEEKFKGYIQRAIESKPSFELFESAIRAKGYSLSDEQKERFLIEVEKNNKPLAISNIELEEGVGHESV